MKRIVYLLLMSNLTCLVASDAKKKGETRQTEVMRTILGSVTLHRESIYIDKVTGIVKSLSLGEKPNPKSALTCLEMYEDILDEAKKALEREIADVAHNKKEIEKLSQPNPTSKPIHLWINGKLHSFNLHDKSTVPQPDKEASSH